MHTHDCINAALGPGDTRELLLAYYKASGATSNQLHDAEAEFLAARGYGAGTLQDRWYAFLRFLGYTGSVQDMQNEYWCVDGGVFPTGSAFTSGFDTGFA